MSNGERRGRLYVARWPGGAVTLLSTESMEHVVDILDEVGEAETCEVVPFDGELWLTFRPAEQPADGPLALDHRPTLEIDSQAEIVEAAYPVLHRTIAAAHRETADGDSYDEPIEPEAWRATRAIEIDRILSPSPEWKAAVERWWQQLAPDAADDDSLVPLLGVSEQTIASGGVAPVARAVEALDESSVATDDVGVR